MPNPKLRLYFREPTVDTNMPITDGTVKIEGFEFEIVKREDDADAWDCGFAARVRAHARGLAHVSIPAFPNRKFRLSYIYVNSKAGIESPRDLEGKRVGIPQWDNTAGVWARGALQNYYKIDLTRINWLSARSKMMSPAPGIQIEPLEQPGDLDSLLLEGALDAVIEPDVLPSITRRDPRVRRLFRDYKTEEQIYFKRTGIFPHQSRRHTEAGVCRPLSRRAGGTAQSVSPGSRCGLQSFRGRQPADSRDLVGRCRGGRTARADGRKLLGVQYREQPARA